MDALDRKDLQPQTMLGMKLIQQPFSKTPDAESLFDFDALKQTRDSVSHHLQFSNLLMVIQGRKGCGKNSFANSLIVSEHPALYFFNCTTLAGHSLNDILAIAAENNHAESIAQLEKRAQDIMFRGQQPVLIVNDAELLGSEQLNALIEYSKNLKDNNQQVHLKLLLLGDHQLEKLLENNGVINHNQFYLIDLPQLNISNTRSFLMHRLNLAGFRDEFPFSEKDITNIFNMANGNPVATLEYAAESLNNNKNLMAEDFSKQSKNKMYLLVAGAVIFISAFIYNSFIASDEPNNLKQNEKLELTETPSTNKKAVEQLFITENKTTESEPSDSTITNSLSNNMSSSIGNTMEVKKQTTTQISAVSGFNPYSTPNSSQQNNTSLADITKALNATDDKALETTTESDNSEQLITEEISTIEVKAAEVESEQTPADNNQASTDAIVSINPNKNSSGIPAPTNTTTKAASKPKATPVVVSPQDKINTAFKKAGSYTAEWLLQQNSLDWSLQILAAYKVETLLSFVQQHQLGNKVAYYRTRLNGKDWHVILYGQYSTKEKAKAVIPYLPSFIQQNSPWPKDLKSVQTAIKAHN